MTTQLAVILGRFYEASVKLADIAADPLTPEPIRAACADMIRRAAALVDYLLDEGERWR